MGDDYLNKTARDAAGAGWGLIALVMVLVFIFAIVALVFAFIDGLNEEWWVVLSCVVLLVAGVASMFKR